MTGSPLRTRIFSSPAGIAATAVVGVALAVGGTVGAVQLTGGSTGAAPPPVFVDPLPTTSAPTPGASATVSPSPSASVSPTPEASRSEAASRSRPRSPEPKPTTAKPRAAKPTTAKPSSAKPSSAKPTTAKPAVVDSGSCGASYYASGQVTANGESFNPDGLTAAHRTLPFGTRVKVTNPGTGDSVTVRINDRGPFVDGRCLDLARGAFAEIAPLSAGHVTVRYEVLG